MGEDMSSSLETVQHREITDVAQSERFSFVTAMSYVRETNIMTKQLLCLKSLEKTCNDSLKPYVFWSLAACYQEKEDYEKADDFYQLCFEGLTDYIEPNALLIYWRNRGVSQRLRGEYEEALDCFQHMLAIAKATQQPKEESSAMFLHLGRYLSGMGKV